MRLKVYLAALNYQKSGSYVARLVYGQQKKVVSNYLEGVSGGILYLTSVIDCLSILNRPTNLKIITESGYLLMTIHRFLPLWMTSDANMNEYKVLGLRMNELMQKHTIEWYFRPIGTIRALDLVYSECMELFFEKSGQKRELFSSNSNRTLMRL